MGALQSPVWTYERRFTFAAPVERAWALFTDPAETRAWLLPFEDDGQGGARAQIDGQQSPVAFTVLETVRNQKLRSSLSGGAIPGRVETTFAFAATPTGSTVLMTHDGYGQSWAWERFGGSFAQGWEEAATDLMAYVHTGVRLARHVEDQRASIAAWPVRRDWGIELVEIFPSGFAEQAGMKAGDILLRLDRMGVYQIADVWAFTRARAAGDEVEATYISDRALRTGKGRLSKFADFGE
jgi:uncharacterized protein YndB with AHSA1/START domain